MKNRLSSVLSHTGFNHNHHPQLQQSSLGVSWGKSFLWLFSVHTISHLALHLISLIPILLSLSVPHSHQHHHHMEEAVGLTVLLNFVLHGLLGVGIVITEKIKQSLN